jgi:hypothetical protein
MLSLSALAYYGILSIPVAVTGAVLWFLARRRFANRQVFIALAIGAALGFLVAFCVLPWVYWERQWISAAKILNHWDDDWFDLEFNLTYGRHNNLTIGAILGMVASWLSLEIAGPFVMRRNTSPPNS